MILFIYLVGWIIFIGGVVWGLMMLYVFQYIIEIVVVILFGIVVIIGVMCVCNCDWFQCGVYVVSVYVVSG